MHILDMRHLDKITPAIVGSMLVVVGNFGFGVGPTAKHVKEGHAVQEILSAQ
jgi:hypothetical protein